MSASWVKFEGTQEQFDEMKNAPHGWVVRLKSGWETPPEQGPLSDSLIAAKELIDQYLICEPLPHAEMIAKHAMTGQPVYCYDETHKRWRVTHNPGWYKDDQYSFSPPKEKRFIEVRSYVSKFDDNGAYCVRTIHAQFPHPSFLEIENCPDFIRWIDQDWRRIEI